MIRNLTCMTLFFTLLLLFSSNNSVAETPQPEKDSQPAPWNFPLERHLEGSRIILHAPQIIAWKNYRVATMLIAAEIFLDENANPIYATIELTGDTEVDVDSRIVVLSNKTVEKVSVLNEANESYRTKLQSIIKTTPLKIPLDIFLTSLAEDAVEVKNQPGFNPTPPIILIKNSPTTILYLNGEPELNDMPGTPYQVVTNANWPLLRDENQGAYMLLSKSTWLASQELTGPWSKMQAAPAEISKLDPEGPFASFRVIDQRDSNVPLILYTKEPTELIVINGEPALEEIPGTEGLSFVNNTRSPVFYVNKQWFLLTAGRWFESDQLDDNDWTLVEKLPPVFSQIPADHGMGYVRSSIPDTLEARTAILEATLPRENTVAADQILELEQSFDGEPKFQAIADTGVSRAINTSHDIIEFENTYYLCYEGAWYEAKAPIGPWRAATDVPSSVYDIPPSSPSYHVTEVAVTSHTSTHVTYSYTSGYSSGIYIAYGMPVYGTGWYYPPYYGYYYPRYYSYGYGSYYNPGTGNYATRSVWYGPYGGYSYNQHYSPRSGRSGYVETAWNGDEWASYGETYNPRTGIYSETSRYYDGDTHRLETEREIARGDKRIESERKVDFNDGWATTNIGTSEGGSAYIESHRQADGSITSSGNITTGDGRTADISRNINNGRANTEITGSEGGSLSKESLRGVDGSRSSSGTVTNADGRTIDSQRQMNNGQRSTEITGSEGGQLSAKGDGQNRGFTAESAQGDLYAGKNGQIYKQSENGWQEYNGGNWKNINNEFNSERRNFSQSNSVNRDATRERSRSNNYSQLNRDSRARQRGHQQLNSRRSGNYGARSGRSRRR